MATMVPVGRGAQAGLPAARGRAGLRGTLRSELTKIWSVRSTIALLFVLYVMTGFLPGSWANHIGEWMPFNAGSAIWQNASASVMFRPWTGFALFCGYAAIALVLGLILFRRSDA